MTNPIVVNEVNALNALELLRVSTNKQDVLRQRADMKMLDKKYGTTPVGTLELVGVSGTQTLDNEEVQKLLDTMLKPHIHGLKTSSIDRLMRMKKFKQMEIFDRFADHKKTIWSAREGLIEPWTDEGYEKCWQAAGKSGSELRELHRRSRDQRNELMDAGQLVCGGGSIPDGLIYCDKRHLTTPRQLVVDEARAAVIRRVFELRAGGMRAPTICRTLWAEGFKSASAGQKASRTGKICDGRWSPQIINKILRNRAYIGEFHYSGRIFECPAIIERDVFNAIQDDVEQARKRNVGPPPKHNLLTGFLWCDCPTPDGRCHHRMRVLTGKRTKPAPLGKTGADNWRRKTRGSNYDYTAYSCGHIVYKPYQKLCFAPQVLARKVEAVAWSAIWSLLTQPARLLALGEAYYKATTVPDTTVEKLERERKELQDEIAVVQQMMKKRLMKFSDGERDINAAEARLLEINVQLRAAGRVVVMPALAEAEAGLRDIIENEPVDFADRRGILESLDSLRMEYFDGYLTITGKVPVPDVSTACGGNNRNRGIGGVSNKYTPIPFILKERVA